MLLDEASEPAPIAKMCMKDLLKTAEGADDGGIASGCGGSTLSRGHDRLRKGDSHDEYRAELYEEEEIPQR